ncbi:unnamed protein product [Orchesella dallaii]|uniref:C2H2-type domain-containing protein n=1 Tax=Orchesella dallaii TaxID=48710 RepID=A0ABP1RUI4_9HEXA
MITCQYCSEPVLRSLPHHVQIYQEFIESGAHIVPQENKGRKRTKCDECDKELRQSDMKRHMRTAHGHGSKPIPCQHCGKDSKKGISSPNIFAVCTPSIALTEKLMR